MVTIEFIDANGNITKFTVPDTVAFAIIDCLKESPKIKKVTWRAWKEVYTQV